MTTTQEQVPSTNANTANGNGTAKRDPVPMTALEAIKKISKVLDQLTPADQKRVLAFINASNE